MAWSHLRMSRILFAATHTMRVKIQLFAGHVLGSRPIKRRKKCASNDNSCFFFHCKCHYPFGYGC